MKHLVEQSDLGTEEWREDRDWRKELKRIANDCEIGNPCKELNETLSIFADWLEERNKWLEARWARAGWRVLFNPTSRKIWGCKLCGDKSGSLLEKCLLKTNGDNLLWFRPRSISPNKCGVIDGWLELYELSENGIGYGIFGSSWEDVNQMDLVNMVHEEVPL